MANTSTPSASVSAGIESMTPSNFNEWADAVPKSVTFADCVSDQENEAIWAKLYSFAGFRNANEKERRSVRAAVYTYCAKNGTSREGDYSGTITLSSGQRIDAAVIPKAAGKMKIRKFLRTNMDESYNFFKTTGVLENDPRFVSRVAALGISAGCAFAICDWLGECPNFTPAEAKAHQVSFARSIERARRARDGKTLETVESDRIDESLRVNGPAYAQSGESFEF